MSLIQSGLWLVVRRLVVPRELLEYFHFLSLLMFGYGRIINRFSEFLCCPPGSILNVSTDKIVVTYVFVKFAPIHSTLKYRLEASCLVLLRTDVDSSLCEFWVLFPSEFHVFQGPWRPRPPLTDLRKILRVGRSIVCNLMDFHVLGSRTPHQPSARRSVVRLFFAKFARHCLLGPCSAWRSLSSSPLSSFYLFLSLCVCLWVYVFLFGVFHTTSSRKRIFCCSTRIL